MTVISSVYKDDDVKCHTSRADPPGERPAPLLSVLSFMVITLPNHMVLFVSLSFALHSLSVCSHLASVVIVAVNVHRFNLLVSSQTPICMLRCLIVVANRRITIYLYLYHKSHQTLCFLNLRKGDQA